MVRPERLPETPIPLDNEAWRVKTLREHAPLAMTSDSGDRLILFSHHRELTGSRVAFTMPPVLAASVLLQARLLDKSENGTVAAAGFRPQLYGGRFPF